MTTMLNTIALFIWVVAGGLNLLTYSNQEYVGKTSYILCWISLLAYIIAVIIQ